jgi:DNA-binding SARP family transcriptional activator
MLVKLHALGQCLIQVDDARIGPDSDLLFGTLLYLVMERGTRVPRSSLVELLWPDVEPERARHCFRQVLYKLRRAGVELVAARATRLHRGR